MVDVYIDDVSFFNVAPADLDRDGRVDLADLSIFTSQWLQQGSGLGADLVRDLSLSPSN